MARFKIPFVFMALCFALLTWTLSQSPTAAAKEDGKKEEAKPKTEQPKKAEDQPAPAKAPEVIVPETKDVRPHTDQQVKEAFKRFDSDIKSEDIDRRLRIVRWLGHYRHKKVLRTLTKIFQRDRDPEMKAAAAEGLGRQFHDPKRAGKALVAGLKKFRQYGNKPSYEDEEEESQQMLQAGVLVSGINGVNRLDYREAWDSVRGFIDHNVDDVAIAMLEFCKRTKEYRALPIIHEWYHYYPDGYSWAGGSVKVDTGAAGGADQAKAKAKYQAKYGGRAKKGRPNAFKAMVAAVKAITGEPLVKPAQLKAWIEANKQLVKTGKKRKKSKRK